MPKTWTRTADSLFYVAGWRTSAATRSSASSSISSVAGESRAKSRICRVRLRSQYRNLIACRRVQNEGLGALRLQPAPAFEPIALELAKTHLRVDSAADDDYIKALIAAARQEAEDFQGRAWITQKWALTMDHFPGWCCYCAGSV